MTYLEKPMLAELDNVSSLPLFAHLTFEEKKAISSIFHERKISAGEKLDLKNDSHFYIQREGIFQSEGTLKRAEKSYLTAGSFFGSVPFSSESPRGVFHALADSRLYCASPDDLHKFFVAHFPALRGYLGIINKAGITASDAAAAIKNRQCSVFTVCSKDKKNNSAAISVAIARGLSSKGDVVVLDLSCGEKSIFDLCSEKITPPVSQKRIGNGQESYINERIIKKDDHLYLMNISYGTKVKIDINIISPIICALADRFDYIILCTGLQSSDVERECCNLSDTVIPVFRDRKGIEKYRPYYDELLNGGQTQHYIFSDRKISALTFLGNRISVCPEMSELDEYSSITEWVKISEFALFCDMISRRKKVLFLETTGYLSLAYASLIPMLSEEFSDNLIVHAPSYAALLFALYHQDPAKYKKKIKSCFSENKLISLVDIVYPKDYIISDSSLKSLTSIFRKDLRLEDIYPQIFVDLSLHDGRSRLYGSGKVREISGALLSDPLLSSGYRVGKEFLFAPEREISPFFYKRRSFGSTLGLKIRSEIPIRPRRIPNMLINAGFGCDRAPLSEKWIYDKNIVIDVDSKRCTIKKILFEMNGEWKPVLEELSGKGNSI